MIVEALRRTADLTPSAPAIEGRGRGLSYAETWRRVCAIARELEPLIGAKRQPIVAVTDERATEGIVAILACWAIGIPYCPVPATQGASNAAALLKLMAPACLISSTHDSVSCLAEAAAGLGVPVVRVPSCDGPDLESAGWDFTPRRRSLLAYVLFTSGSTGEPKAVLVPWVAVDNLASWAMARLAGKGPRRVAGVSRLTFDLSVLDLLVALGSGGCYVVVDAPEVQDPRCLARRIHISECDFVQTTPSIWSSVVSYLERCPASERRGALSSVRTVVLAGENLHHSVVRAWFRLTTNSVVCNMYGPTETIHVTCHWMCSAADLPSDGFVPIGEPIDGVRLDVVDEDLQPVAPGSIGQIVISGPCVAQGYLAKEPEAPFIASFPFREGAERAFLTGDLARREAHGLVVTGRTDDQVKIHGQRFHLGVLEAAALQCTGVRAALAYVVRSDATVATLGLAVESDDPPDRVRSELRAHLRARVPAALRPRIILVETTLPRSAHGKLDRPGIVAELATESRLAVLNPAAQLFLYKERLAPLHQEHPQLAFVLESAATDEAKFEAARTRLAGEWVSADREWRWYAAPQGDLARFLHQVSLEPFWRGTQRVRLLIAGCELPGGRTVLALRGHHAWFGELDLVFRARLLLGALARGPARPRWSVDPGHGKLRTYRVADETRWLLRIDLRGNSTPARKVGQGTHLLATHLEVLERLVGHPAYLEVPVVRPEGYDGARPLPAMVRTQLWNGANLAGLAYVARAQELLRGAPGTGVTGSQHRFNFLPLGRILETAAGSWSVVPVDLFETLPPLTEGATSVTTQTIGGVLLVVIRSYDRGFPSQYAKALQERLS